MTMTAPTRALAAIRPTASIGLLASTAAISATFMATPFVILETIEVYGVSAGWAALLSTAQVGGFTITNLYAGRRLQAGPELARRAIACFAICNLLSAITLAFPLLVILRTMAGASMGLLTWIAWADSAADTKKRGDVAAVGPLSSAIFAPLIALVATGFGLTGIYLILAAVVAGSFLLPLQIESTDMPSRRPIETPGVTTLLFALSLFMAGGSGVFVFGRVLADEHIGMSALTFSLILSANALVSIPVARYSGRRRFPGLWMMTIAACAVLMATTESAAVFATVIVVWGLAFWAVIPEVFSILSDKSVHPADRVGDAQAVMSMGRVIGPSIAGVLVGAGSFTALGWVSAALILTAAGAVQLTTSKHRWQ